MELPKPVKFERKPEEEEVLVERITEFGGETSSSALDDLPQKKCKLSIEEIAIIITSSQANTDLSVSERWWLVDNPNRHKKKFDKKKVEGEKVKEEKSSSDDEEETRLRAKRLRRGSFHSTLFYGDTNLLQVIKPGRPSSHHTSSTRRRLVHGKPLRSRSRQCKLSVSVGDLKHRTRPHLQCARLPGADSCAQDRYRDRGTFQPTVRC